MHFCTVVPYSINRPKCMISLKIAPKSGRLYGKLHDDGKPNAGAGLRDSYIDRLTIV